jgi:hypothetical protein
MNVESRSGGSPTQERAGGSNITDAVVDTMVRWPIRMTGATMDFMLQGVQRVASATRDGMSSGVSSGTQDASASASSTSSRTSGSTASGWTSLFSGSSGTMLDQDLSGDDLKYVIWSIVFTKPGYECILQTQQEELVSYAADGNAYAAVKIAQFLDGARHGHVQKPAAWSDRYPAPMNGSRATREETTTVITTPASTTATVSATGKGAAKETSGASAGEKGWRVPPEDQKYITFLYRVDRRLARQEEVTRVDRVTVERGTRIV